MSDQPDLSIPVFLRASAARRRADWEAHIQDRMARGLTPYTNPNAQVEGARSSWADIEEAKSRKASMSWLKRKGVLEDQQAQQEGKTWDPVKGCWV